MYKHLAASRRQDTPSDSHWSHPEPSPVLPVACSLIDADLQERRRTLFEKITSAVFEVKEVDEGFAYVFVPAAGRINELANLIELEHRCCPFLRFRLSVEPGDGQICLEMTGPKGTKEFLAELFHA